MLVSPLSAPTPIKLKLVEGFVFPIGANLLIIPTKKRAFATGAGSEFLKICHCIALLILLTGYVLIVAFPTPAN